MSEAQNLVTALLEDGDEADPKAMAMDLAPQKVYRSIVFLQGDQATEALDVLNLNGEDAALEMLAQYDAWDSGGEHEETEEPWGTSDDTFEGEVGGVPYVMSYNTRLGYIGLCRIEDKFIES